MHEQLQRIREVARRSKRYRPEAFLLVSQVVGYTVKLLKEGKMRPADNPGGQRGDAPEEFHVSGRELLQGLRVYGSERWGAMAPCVLRSWGLRCCEDVGEVVFTMVEDEKLAWRKRECDTREDFADGYDFDTAFEPWPEI